MTIEVIAEAGVNHNGEFMTALGLIDAAKAAGADTVKFQLFDAELLHKPQLKPLQLSRSDMLTLKAYCEKRGLGFLCTPFDAGALEWLAAEGMTRLKLASGALWNEPLLEAARGAQLPLLVSTGMSAVAEVRRAMQILEGSEVTLLHCTSAYPAPLEHANLRAIGALRRAFGCQVGYSDHTGCGDALVAAAALGATVIEAHITLDRMQPGPDHASSHEPQELAAAIRSIRRVQALLGDGIKRMQDSEERCRKLWEAA